MIRGVCIMYNHFTVMLRHDFLLKSEIRLHNSENRLDYVTSNALIDTDFNIIENQKYFKFLQVPKGSSKIEKV